MHAELAISTERVIPLVFTTGPVAIAKCLDNGQLAVIILVLTIATLHNV